MDTALQWCTDHASKLRRLNSVILFFIRQEQVLALPVCCVVISYRIVSYLVGGGQFLELVYAGKTIEALHFAQVRIPTCLCPFPGLLVCVKGGCRKAPTALTSAIFDCLMVFVSVCMYLSLRLSVGAYLYSIYVWVGAPGPSGGGFPRQHDPQLLPSPLRG